MSAFEKRHVHQVYESIAKPFDESRFCHWNAVRSFLDNIPKGSLVLDNGCGNGKYLQYRNDVIFIGNDMCNGLLEVAKHKADVTRSNGLNLSYRNDSFDAIICIAVFHHLSDKERRIQFIKEMKRIVKRGGKILITVWAKEQINKRMKDWQIAENGDSLIPWKDKLGNIISMRYYHLFTEKELHSYFQIEGIKVISCIYEFDNWCIVVECL